MIHRSVFNVVRAPILICAVGCVVGLLIWPSTPQMRFLAVLLLGVLPIATYYGLTRLAQRFKPVWTHFRLASVFALTALIGLGLKYGESAYRRDRFVSAVQAMDGEVLTKPRLSTWLAERVALLQTPDRVYLKGVTDSDLQLLASMPGADTVTILTIENSSITDHGLLYLASFESCESLYIDNCEVTNVGVDNLARMPALKYVQLRNTKSQYADGSLLHSLSGRQFRVVNINGV